MAANGASYSLNGYINALRLRSTKTVLVEGKSDTVVLKRLWIEGVQPPEINQPFFDEVDLVSDSALVGMGNKQRVLSVQQHVEQADVPTASAKLATLTDKEWDGLSFAGDQLEPDSWPNEVGTAPAFVTKGHSIENYHFNVDCLIAYLKFAVAPAYTSGLEAALRAIFSSILILAARYTWSMGESQLIKRCGRLLTPADISFSESYVWLETSVVEKLEERGVMKDVALQLVGQINSSATSTLSSMQTSTDLRWLIHGHIGTNLIWACVAKLAEAHGASADQVNLLARANCDMRDSYWREWLAQQAPDSRRPLDAVLQWAGIP